MRIVPNVRFVSTMRFVSTVFWIDRANNYYNWHAICNHAFGLAAPRCVASLFAPRVRENAVFA